MGDAADALRTVRLKMGEGIAGWVAKHGEPLIVPDVYTDPRFAKRIDEMTKWQTRSIICIPLKSKHRVLAVIQLINVPMSSFSDSEMFFLRAICDYAAIAIDNARAVERIQELTITDDCTGLYNARHLYKTLESEVYRSARFGYEFTVLFIDLDHFKQVNDTHGHLVGSKLLAEIGYTIKSHLRLIDYAFRYGGDEFVVLLPQTGKDSGLIVARRLLDSFRKSKLLKDEEFEPQHPRLHRGGLLPGRRQERARDHPPGRRDDVRGQEHQPRQYRRFPARHAEMRTCAARRPGSRQPGESIPATLTNLSNLNLGTETLC